MLLPACAGSILLLWEMKKQLMRWQAGLPLCITIGIITLSLAVFSFAEPSDPVLRLLGLSITTIMIGYAVLPFAAIYFFNNITTGGVAKSGTKMSFFSLMGLCGPSVLILSWLMSLYESLTTVQPARMDIWQFSLIDVLIILLYLLYGLVLLPITGILFIILGMEFLKQLPEPTSERPCGSHRMITAGLITILVILALAAAYAMNPAAARNDTVVIIKLTYDGSPEWIKTIDSGGDVKPEAILQAENGGYIVTYRSFADKARPGTGPNIIRLTNTGDLVWERSSQMCELSPLISATEDGFATASGDGGICVYNSTGHRIWKWGKRTIGSTESLLQNADGEFIVVGNNRTDRLQQTITGLDKDGDELWSILYNNKDVGNLHSITELSDHTGYLMTMNGNYLSGVAPSLYVARMDNQGTLSDKNLVSPGADYISGIFIVTSDEYVVFYRNLTNYAAQINQKGEITGTVEIPNVMSNQIISTQDGGFFFAGFAGPDNSYSASFINNKTTPDLHAVKLNSKNLTEWDKPVPGIQVTRVSQIIPTMDGGFAILSSIRNGI
jgi:hypothetical protein